MPTDDRERLFEKALAQHLRSSSAAARDSACLDAETLAAYQDRLLAPEELDAAKTHLVSCARCQEILAQLEAPQDMHELQNREHALIAAGAAPRAGKVARFPAGGNSLLRWAAPAGAIAAGLLLLIAIRDFRSAPKRAEPATQIADNRSDRSRHPEFAPAAPQPIEKQKSEMFARRELKEQPAAPPAAELLEQLRSSRAPKRSLARSSSDKKSSARAPLAPPAPAQGAGESDEPSFKADSGKISAKNKLADGVSQSAASDSIATTGDAVAIESKAAAAGGAAALPPPPAPSPAKPALPAQTLSVEASAAAPLLKDAEQTTKYRHAIFDLAALPAIASAPDGKSIWRFGEHGGIAHSRDGGRTWEAQFAPLTVSLRSASAPAEKICWIAGAAGTLLRTADAGKHWQLVTTPISGDLGGVRASDAQHATIWDVPMRQSYETSDGGATWKPTGKE